MTTTAAFALQKIRALRKYPLPQASIAEQRILKTLNVPDFTSVIQALETPLAEVPKEITEIRTRKSPTGGFIHEHHHTDPELYPMEEHTSGNLKGVMSHLKQAHMNRVPCG